MEQEALPISAPRFSRDEMNLAEFPLTVLSTRVNSSAKTLEFRDTIKKKNGEVVDREWIITAADKFGLPTASDDEVLLGLLKLTVDQGFASRKVYFTRYELLKGLCWTTEGRSYTRLQRALDRLSGVRIKATNAFFDNSAKSLSTINFGIIDAYEINDGRDGATNESKPSFFTWSEVLFNSFQVGYIKKLDLGFYLSLESAVSKRLFRYLDKHFWYRSTVRMNVFLLAHEKLGISRNYRFLSSLRQQLDPALEELVARNFVSKFSYEGRGPSAEIVIQAARANARSEQRLNRSDDSAADSDRLNIQSDVIGASDQLRERIVASEQNIAKNNFVESNQSSAAEVSSDIEALEIRDRLEQLLIARGIKPIQLSRLLNDKQVLYERMEKIIEHFDSLVERRSRLVSLSPIGFLYRAIENAAGFRLPEDLARSQTELGFQLKKGNVLSQIGPAKSAATGGLGQDSAGEYLVFRKRELQRIREEVEPELLSKIRSEVEEGLIRLKSSISSQKFNETVEFGVEQKLAALFAVPSIDEWIKASSIRRKAG